MIRDIYVHGAAGREFGRHFRLHVSSPAEAVRALITLRPGLRAVLRRGTWRVIVGPPHLANAIELAHVHMRAGAQPLHLVPATGAAGGGGIGKAVAGVALIGASIVTAGLAAPAGVGILGALGATASIGGVGLGFTYGAVALAGASMVLGGISTLLTQPPQQSQATQATAMATPGNQPSFLFNGVTNNSQQGGPVPLVFGTHLVGSVVASAGLVAEDIA